MRSARSVIGVGGAAMVSLAIGLVPAGAVPISTPLATAENVRHVNTVPGTTGGHVVVQGDRLYMGNYGTGLSVYDITDAENPVQLGQYLPGPSTDGGGDPGARADAVPDAAVWDGVHIVTLAGTSRADSTTQTEFIDFTDPANPELLWRFRGDADGEAHNGDIVDIRKLWLPSGGGGTDGLRIYDLSPLLKDPPEAPVNLFRGNPFDLWNESPYRKYYRKEVGFPFNHTHDIRVYPDKKIILPEWEWKDLNGDGTRDPVWGKRDIALLAGAGGGNQGAAWVIDITDPKEPVVISKWHNPAGGEDNPIGYLHEAHFLHGDRDTVFVADEDFSGCDEGRLYTIHISDDLVEMTKLGEWAIAAGTHDTPLCMGSHVFSSNDRYVFMGAYAAGLQIIDLHDPAEPTRAGRFIAEGMNSWGALYHQGYVYVGDLGARGLDVFEFMKDEAASEAGRG